MTSIKSKKFSKKLKTIFCRFLIHTIIEDGLCYLCIAHRDMGRRTPYLFLEEVKKRFINSGSLYQRSTSAAGYEFNRDFSRNLYDVMSDFNSGKGDNLSVLQNQVCKKPKKSFNKNIF